MQKIDFFIVVCRSNLNVFIKSVCKSLAIVVKKGTDGKENSAQLKVWEATVTCLQDLVVVVKNEDGIANLRQFLKVAMTNCTAEFSSLGTVHRTRARAVYRQR